MTVSNVRKVVQDYAIKDLIVCVEMTGTYHLLIWRTFRDAGFETRIVHPFKGNAPSTWRGSAGQA